MNVILFCDCGVTRRFVEDAFNILFPDKPIPEMVKPDDELLSMVRTHIRVYKGWNTEFDEKYAYYLNNEEYNEDMVIYDLMTGEKIC